ncbi:FeoA family protein [Enemella sp. A6]|uniref:FeoA family protein n=1 Tax=Enemella sp. A6 TaxID=3440152 RepID=UPI003EC0E841
MPGFNLVDAPKRHPLMIVEAHPTAAVARRLASLGLRRGAEIEILHTTAGGGRVVAVAGSRVALGKDLLRDFRVETHD